jgi:hypothetical protein
MLRPRQDIDEFIKDIQRTKNTRRTSSRLAGPGKRKPKKSVTQCLEGSSDLASVTQMQRAASPRSPPPAPRKSTAPILRENVRKRNLSSLLDEAEEPGSLVIPSPPVLTRTQITEQQTGLLLYVFKQARKTDKTIGEVVQSFNQLPAQKKRKAAAREKQFFEE